MTHALLVTDVLKGYMLDTFYEEAKKRNIVLHRHWEKCDEQIDFTINRRYLEHYIPIQQGIQINRIVDGIFWKDKKKQHNILPTGCEKPTTIIGKGHDYQYIVEILGSPFIAKESIASQGVGVYMIHNKMEYAQAANCDIFQTVVWPSIGKDVRVFCINGKPIRCMLRQNEHNFKSNFHQGGKGIIYPCDDRILNIANTIYKYTNLDLMGIDLLLDGNDYIFCELNTNPGFEELDKTFKTATAGDILDHCLTKLR